MGAKVTGIDLSDKAIETAIDLALQCGTDTEFICSDVYNLPNVLNQKFDIVYTSYGTIGWLPDLEKWAGVISHFLKPGGQFIMAEFHPVVWMFDDDFIKVAYNYFNEKPIVETYEGTYADQSAPIVQEYVMWNHSLAEVLDNLVKKRCSWRPSGSLTGHLIRVSGMWRNLKKENGEFHSLEKKIPIVFALMATKK